MVTLFTLAIDWGIRPVLFRAGPFPVESYPVFVVLAVTVALALYYFSHRSRAQFNDSAFFIAVGAIFGGALGAKLPIWIANYQEILQAWPDVQLLLSGRTIVGGIVGGAIGVNLVKWRLNIKERRGNALVIPVCAGIAIGRIGCLLRGCCFGKPTHTNFGVNFGDGTLRHPTQAYEIIFVLLLMLYSLRKSSTAHPGELWQNFMIAYFSFRFFIEFIREEPVVAWHLTAFQIASLCIAAYHIINFKIIPKFYAGSQSVS